MGYHQDRLIGAIRDLLFILTVMQINSHVCVCCANQFTLLLLLNLYPKSCLTTVCLLGVLEYPGKDTVVVVCVCVWIPTDSGVYPWGSGRDPVGCVIFTGLCPFKILWCD